MKVENAVEVEHVGEFELKGIRRPLAAYNVIGVGTSIVWGRPTVQFLNWWRGLKQVHFLAIHARVRPPTVRNMRNVASARWWSASTTRSSRAPAFSLPKVSPDRQRSLRKAEGFTGSTAVTS
jgi:hypothetical protein